MGTGANLLAEGEIAHASLLGSDAKLVWKQDRDELRIALPPERPGDFAYVVKLALN